MATATKRKPRTKSKPARHQIESDPGQHEAEISHTHQFQTQIQRDLEPLEGALRRREAPEALDSRESEAPDGELGAYMSSEDSFTQGRSKS
jgi:hypothetical protein